MRKHVKIRITGRVQGVFFRAATKEKADALNIVGRVRNERDGSVYAEAEGQEEKVSEFIAWCHHGPPSARVEKCEVMEGALQHYDRFVIER